MAPDEYKQSLSIMRSSAEKQLDCKLAFPCGQNNVKQGDQQNLNSINANATDNHLSRRWALDRQEKALLQTTETEELNAEEPNQDKKLPAPPAPPATASKDKETLAPTIPRFSRSSFYW